MSTTLTTSMTLRVRWFCLVLLCLCAQAARAQGIGFTASGDMAAAQDRLGVQLTLTLNAPQPIYNVRVFAHTQSVKGLVGSADYWEPGARRQYSFSLPSDHLAPGDYKLLVEVAFQDSSGANLGVAIALDYAYGPKVDKSGRGSASGTEPGEVSASIFGDRLHWNLPDQVAASGVSLTFTTEPSWRLAEPLHPPVERFDLKGNGERAAIPNWTYTQKARLDWVQGGRHYSRVQDWVMRTGPDGNWTRGAATEARPIWRRPAWLWGAAVLLLVVTGLLGWRTERPPGRILFSDRQEFWIAGATLLALTIWAVAHTQPALWFTRTWDTGGDVASQVFYAHIFMDWLPTGKISGWLPESFAGFPAFTFYFPLPFSMAGLLQFLLGQQVAFKLVAMLPAFLLPAATFALGGALGWRATTRLLAAVAVTGLILGGATSIWGGNVLAQLAGEFSYAWGMVFAALFWGALALSLRRGGKWWLVAAVLEALVALSHGYALLVGGFGAFLFLLESRAPWRDLRTILQVHLLAFLLIGFWLMPLAQNLPWTIPNDTPTALGNWATAWPRTLWPLVLGWVPLVVIVLFLPRGWPRGMFILAGICLLALFGFNVGGRLGLADLRFFAYAQWALAAASGAALAWLLQRWLPAVALPLAIAATLAICAWWEPQLGQMETWSRWNLSGYETKALWPQYLATAQANAGPLEGPRLVFEHDPANSDLGSTRTMEALPMFGSRPALEGLYMESALSGPFIYQLQAEVSERPSSPLSRFPSTARSMEDAVGHMKEFYADRLVLRSAAMKALYGADPRFRLVARHGPLDTYELDGLTTHLVDVVQLPLVERSRKGWLREAFSRYIMAFPYRERHAYLREGEHLPAAEVPSGPAHVHIESFSRERLVFTTDQPGQPHLIRMTYHPRWASKGGEPIYLVEPSFMLIYPRSTTVELDYGWSWGNYLGLAFSVAGLAMLALGLLWRTASPAAPQEPVGGVHRGWLLVLLGVAVLGVLGAWWTDPERAYLAGHREMAASQYEQAAHLFDQAFRGRHNPAGQAEALFWAARSLDLGGLEQEALQRYDRLRHDFPENYWYPESVYRMIEIHLAAGDTGQAESLHTELAGAVPDSIWTVRAGQLLEAARSGH